MRPAILSTGPRVCLAAVLLHAAIAAALGLSTPIAHAAPPVAQPSPETKQKIAQLKAIAIGEDRFAAAKAFDDLMMMADPARPTLIETLRSVLVRDKSVLEDNIRKVTAGGDIKPVEADLAKQRKAALDRIATIKAADMNQARAEYTKLAASAKRLSDMYASRSTLIDVARVRPNLLQLWSMIAPKTGPNPIDPAAEQKLADAVKQALGEAYTPILQQLQARRAGPADPPVNQPEQAGLLGYRARKQTEAYNKSLASTLDPAELELIGQINTYRDVLGLSAVEVDARLTQAARRHSKAMVEQKFFGVAPPSDPNQTAPMRLKAAGFEAGEVWSESLTRNFKSGTQAFWGMFDQPPYHQNMTAETLTSIGVGKWGLYWTVDLAAGKRLMHAADEERTAAAAQGEIVPPQTSSPAVARTNGGNNPANNQPTNETGMTDPRNIKPRPPGGGTPGIGGVPSIGGF